MPCIIGLDKPTIITARPLKIRYILDLSPVDSGGRAERYLSRRVEYVIYRLGREVDLAAEVRLANRRHVFEKRSVVVGVVDVHEVDATRVFSLLHERGEELDRGHRLLPELSVLLGSLVQLAKLVYVSEERVVHFRDVVRREEGHVSTREQPLVHDLVELDAVVHVSDAIVFRTLVVLQD